MPLRVLTFALLGLLSSRVNAEAALLPAAVPRAVVETAEWAFGVVVDFETLQDDEMGRRFDYSSFGGSIGREVYAASWRPGLFTVTVESEFLRGYDQSFGLEIGAALDLELRPWLTVGVHPLLGYTDRSFVAEDQEDHGTRELTPGVDASVRWKWSDRLVAAVALERDLTVSAKSTFAVLKVEADLGDGFGSEVAYSRDLSRVEEDATKVRFGYWF